MSSGLHSKLSESHHFKGKGDTVNYRVVTAFAAAAVLLVLAGTASAEGTFEGRKKCYNCHKSEGKSWKKSLRITSYNVCYTKLLR